MLENGFQPPVSFHHLLFSQGRKSGKYMVVIRYNTCRIAMETSSALLLLLLPIIRFLFHDVCVRVHECSSERGIGGGVLAHGDDPGKGTRADSTRKRWREAEEGGQGAVCQGNGTCTRSGGRIHATRCWRLARTTDAATLAFTREKHSHSRPNTGTVCSASFFQRLPPGRPYMHRAFLFSSRRINEPTNEADAPLFFFFVVVVSSSSTFYSSSSSSSLTH